MTVENIDGTSGGSGLFNTKMPGYDDPADIQAALKLYHYGSATYDGSNTNPSNLPNPSIARHLQTLADGISAINSKGIGSSISATRPTVTEDGYIWVDATSTFGPTPSVPTAIYQNEEPTETFSEGALWVDKNASPLAIYVYDSSLGWRKIG
jgi:hypothetical protein